MSTPESNEARAYLDKPDAFDNLSAVFCQLSLMRVLEEAKICNQLAVDDDGVVSVNVEITDEDANQENNFHLRELVQLKAAVDSEMQDFGIKHAIYLRGEDFSYDLYMLRMYGFLYAPEPGQNLGMSFNSGLSTCSVQLNTVKQQEEGVWELYNEGAPLSPEQNDIFKELKSDIHIVKNHQFNEVKVLMTRMLDSVRSQA